LRALLVAELTRLLAVLVLTLARLVLLTRLTMLTLLTALLRAGGVLLVLAAFVLGHLSCSSFGDPIDRPKLERSSIEPVARKARRGEAGHRAVGAEPDIRPVPREPI
jgi:hypothetical protein